MKELFTSDSGINADGIFGRSFDLMKGIQNNICIVFLKFLKEKTGNYGKEIMYSMDLIEGWIRSCFPSVDACKLSAYVCKNLSSLIESNQISNVIAEFNNPYGHNACDMLKNLGGKIGLSQGTLQSDILDKIIAQILLNCIEEKNRSYSFGDFSVPLIGILNECSRLRKENTYTKFIGNEDWACLLVICNLLDERNIDIKNFYPIRDDINEKFDFVTVVNKLHSRYSKQEIESLIELYPEYEMFCQSETWIDAIPALKNLKSDGIGAIVLAEGSGFESDVYSIRARKYLLDNNKLKAVYTLPLKLFKQTGVRCVLYLIGNTDGNVKLVDLEKYINKDINFSTNDEKNYFLLQNCINEAEKNAVYVSQFDDKNYSLNVTKHMYKKEYSCKTEKLGVLLDNFYRGIQIPNSELQKNLDEIDGSKFILVTNSDIEDCCIDDSAKKIGKVDLKQQKFVVSHSEVLLLSKMGPKFKVGITDCSDGGKYLVSSNLYALEVNKDKLEPYYLLYFLNSEAGRELLKNNSAGTNIPTLNNDDIKNLDIPFPDKKVQKKLAEEMRLTVKKIHDAKRAYKKKIQDLDDTFNNLIDSIKEKGDD